MSGRTNKATSGQNIPKSKLHHKSQQEQVAASKLRMEKRSEQLDKAKEKLAKQKPQKKPGPVKEAGRAAGATVHGYVHGKLYEVEHENVGTESAHRAELVGEAALRSTSRYVKRKVREHPTKAVQRAESRHRMQRKVCHRFAEQMGWTIIHEEQEDGVSGHKVRAENRDKVQIIKEHAKQGKFDILLVFMFDRIGRIADETPFVVEWFVKNGIRVWSTQEGEQRFDSHTDKLTNYIRFWQADGESEKTSIRTKTALGQLVEDGNFKGGAAPYGYDLVKSGRINKRKHEVFGLAVNEAEAAVVRIIFDKYVNEGFGVQRIASYLNGLGYRARTGKCWHHSSIRGMICNLTYTGVLRSGESRSDVQPHLQIIPPELYDAAQNIRTSRANVTVNERHVPMNTRGQSLLAGNVFCGHCGSRLCLTTNGKPYPCKADPNRIVKRIRYICYGKTRKQTECDGQTGYTTHVLDGIIDKVIRQIFERMKAVPKSEIVNARYQDKMVERKALLRAVKAEHAKAAAELDMLKAEVIKSLRGESSFSQDLLSSLIAESETKCLEVQKRMESAQTEVDEGQAVLDALNAQYNDIITWSEMYDSASIEAKKMIVNCLINLP